MLTSLDSFLIDKVFQPFSHKVQRATGMTCFRIAWLLMGIAIVGYFFQVNNNYHRDMAELGTISGPLWVQFLLVPVLVIALSFRLTLMDKRERQGWTSNTANRERITNSMFRPILFVYVVVMNVTSALAVIYVDNTWFEMLIDNWALTAWVLADYFAACTPLPPGWQTSTKGREAFQAG